MFQLLFFDIDAKNDMFMGERGGLDSVSSHSNNLNFQGKKSNPTLMSVHRKYVHKSSMA